MTSRDVVARPAILFALLVVSCGRKAPPPPDPGAANAVARVGDISISAEELVKSLRAKTPVEIFESRLAAVTIGPDAGAP